MYNLGALLIAALAAFGIVCGLWTAENPLLTGDEVGGLIVNLILLGYGLNAVLMTALALVTRGTRPQAYRIAAGVLAVGLALAYLTLEVTRIYHGPVLTVGRTTNAEQYTYSAAPRRQEVIMTGVLLDELNHRVNNEFTSAIGLVSRAAARSGNDEVKLALTGVAELLHCYAQVHHALQIPERDDAVDAAPYLRNLCALISRSKLGDVNIKLVFAAPPLPLRASEARITKSKAVGALFGLTPKKYQSGETDVTGRITRVGDEMVRTALYEAAAAMLTRVTRFSALKHWAVNIAKRRGAKRAKVALARKLGVVLHRIWVDNSTFHWTKAKAEPAMAA